MLIGLAGYARSGKDTVANYLVREAGFTRISFAEPMKQALYTLNPLITVADMRGIPLATAVDGLGWENVKADSPEVRGLLQRLGTEVGREMFGEDFWVNLAMKEAAKYEHVVISDCRFVNEALAIRNAGGEVWRVVRPDTGPINGHSSETALDDFVFDATLRNHSGIPELEEAAANSLFFYGI